MRRIIFDTDVLIEQFRGNEAVENEIRILAQGGAVLAYTPVSVAEIYRGMRSQERARTERLLQSFECLDLTQAVGKRAGDYLRTYSKSHGLEMPDALIAAAAFVHKFALCTFNWKHYPMSDISKHRLD